MLAAGGYAAVFLAHHDVAMAIAGAAIMLAYGAVLVVFSRRSEVAALLRDTANDERHALINLRACALALYAVVTVAVVMMFINLARNGNPGTWGTVCAILGAPTSPASCCSPAAVDSRPLRHDAGPGARHRKCRRPAVELLHRRHRIKERP